MAKKIQPVLRKIDHDQVITRENHFEFLYQLQNALLLALMEQGRLSTMQYRCAEEKLKAQRRKRVRELQQKGTCL